MNFQLNEAMEILDRTPRTLAALLTGLSDNWLASSEGEGTWNALEVLRHLIEAEQTNWIPRLAFILQDDEAKPFPPFDRFAHLSDPKPLSLEQLLQHFADIRSANVSKLKALIPNEEFLERQGIHPALGTVKARELIATWAVHDLTHTSQITRVLAERYRSDVGPWIEYLSILNKGRNG